MPADIPANLPPESMPWARDLVKRLQDLEGERNRLAQAEQNSSSSLTATLQTQAQQIQSLNSTIASLNSTITYLNGLTTTSATGSDFNTGTTPGDSTFRWAQSSPALTLQTQCPTGKLLVTVGTGECTLQAGNASAVAVVSFSASSPSGWSFALDNVDSRLYLTSGQYLGVPLVANAPLTGVPTNEVITINVWYGIWSASATTLASANFQSNYVLAQVTG